MTAEHPTARGVATRPGHPPDPPAHRPEPPVPSTQPQRPADFRTLMAGFPTGVTIVTTTGADGVPWGMTLTSLCSVSLEPPILLVCMRRGSPTLDAVLDSGRFAVNLLRGGAQSTAELFASGAADRFDRVAWGAGEGAAGPHLFQAAYTIADCSVTAHHTVGDHVVIMGGVTRVVRQGVQQPLLYGLRSFAVWPEAEGFLSYDFML
ncbi:flavin reductase family protein [Streptomyces sp. NBC_01803]|uniref:flavin reductase family protein n=1 Tax=Streptomyces sp. NBC_01803 TaxID=2975946 RepID=UPI002DDC1568|nr:flavin reductase family protein [Streptomyces sp. NBC_01803]WSA43159.1 flavin reductase family protein [Streptomyces sp. NBC_01803]